MGKSEKQMDKEHERNQRIIDVPASLSQGTVVLSPYDDDNQRLE